MRRTSLPTAEASGLPYDQLIGSDEFPNALIDERFEVVIDPLGGDLRTTSLDVMLRSGDCWPSATPAAIGGTA